MSVITSQAAGSPSWASSVTSAPVISRPESQRAPERAVGRLARQPQALGADRVTRHERLQAAVVGAASRARRAVGVDDDVAELGRRPAGAVHEPPVDDEAAADAGAERQHDRVARPARLAPAPLGEHRRVAVVVDRDGQAEPLGQHVAHGDAVQREVVGVERHARLRIDQAGDAEPDREHLRGRRLDRLLHRLDELVDQRAGVVRARQAIGAVMHLELRVDRPGEQLRPSQIDADDAAGGHDRPPYLAAWRTPRRLPSTSSIARDRAFPGAAATTDRCSTTCARRRRASAGASRSPSGAWSNGSLLALVVWVGLSLVLFLISAQVNQDQVSAGAQAQLSGGGVGILKPQTTLILGSDQRTAANKEPGASTTGPSRSDSILLVRTGGGHSAKLSIPRDTVVDIPGHGRNKINAAYAFGGAALTVQTIKQYLGIPIDHVFEVNFDNFPALVDAMGGIDYTGGCVVSRINGGFKNGGFTLRLRRGTTHIDGKQALALARTRHNDCNAKENDLTRARRQQKVISAMKSRVFSPAGFIRLPFISWNAPKTLKTDMRGPALLGLRDRHGDQRRRHDRDPQALGRGDAARRRRRTHRLGRREAGRRPALPRGLVLLGGGLRRGVRLLGLALLLRRRRRG